MLIVMSTLLAVFLFAGREFAGATEVPIYEIADASLSGLWFITAVVCVCGHFRWRSQRKTKQELRRLSTMGHLEWNDFENNLTVGLGELGVEMI